MSKVYPSDLLRHQYEFLNDILPPAKASRPRRIALGTVLNAIARLAQ